MTPCPRVFPLPQHNLYDIGTYLHRDIVQTVFRFAQQVGKFEGWLKYVVNGTTKQFRPDQFMNDVLTLNNNVADLKRRLDVSKDRGNMSLTLVSGLNYPLPPSFQLTDQSLD
jgi:hypothetical protein